LNIVVTGGVGFLGRATIHAAFAAGHEAWAFDHHLGHDVLGNLDQLSLSPSMHPDVVIHLAGVLGTDELFDDIERAIQINVTGAARVLDWCHRNGAGYVGITMPPVFPSVYTATKLAADRLASAYHHAYQLPVSHVRAFNAYGPGQAHGPGHPRKIIPSFSVQGWRNEPLLIWGDGEQIVDLVHADDIGRMLVDADHGQRCGPTGDRDHRQHGRDAPHADAPWRDEQPGSVGRDRHRLEPSRLEAPTQLGPAGRHGPVV